MVQVSITYEDPDAWENNRDKVSEILNEATGTSDYPETKSLPPIIIGPDINQDVIDKLKALPGVIVRIQDDD